MKARRNPIKNYCIYMLRIAGLLGLAFAAGGCGGEIFPDSRMKTSGVIEEYEHQLERRLLNKYNNLTDYAGKISKVDLILTHKPLKSVTGDLVKVEFCQLVFDQWNRRVPELEEEYFVITFGSGEVRQVRTDPSIEVGLKSQGGYSESAPISSGLIGQFDSGLETPQTPPPPLVEPERSPSTYPRTKLFDDSSPDEVPTVPAVPEVPMPTRITENSGQSATEASTPPPLPKLPPRYLQGMAAPNLPSGRIPRAEIHNLPKFSPSRDTE